MSSYLRNSKYVIILSVLLMSSIPFNTALAGMVTVSWDPNSESDLSGYKVYYGTESRNYSTVIDVGNITSHVIDNLQDGKTYYFAVTAYDLSQNESGFSEEVSASLSSTNNNPPELVAVVIMGETQIDLIFSEPLDKTSAEIISNYSINNGIQVLAAILDQDLSTVHLLTTQHERGKTYVVSVSNIKDLDQNSIAAGTSKSYSLHDPANDTTPPQLVYVNILNETQLDVIFNEPIERTSAEDINNYTIDNGVQVLQASLNDNLSVVRLTTTAHQRGVNYTLSVSNIRDLATNPNVIQPNSSVSYALSNSSDDTSPPQLVYAIILNETQLDVIFNEPVEKSSAEDVNNYSIDNGVQVLQASLNVNLSVVRLTTTAHQKGVTYTLSVSNIRDLATNPNVIQPNSSVSYALSNSSDDTSPPQLVYAIILNETQLDVIFNEPIERTSAEDINNYTIDNGIQVLQASLNVNLSVVRLTTTAHQKGVTYTLSVSNIRDLATNPNVIQPNSSLTYRLQGDDATDTTPPVLVSVIINGATQLDVNFSEPIERTSAENEQNYTISGNIQIMAAVLDNNLTTVHLITSAHQQGDTYTLTMQNIKDRAQPPNTIAPNSSSSYTYTSDDNSGDTGGDGQQPAIFSLFQNYPNPFNPETEIRFFLEEARDVSVKVYNMLGQVVKTLVKQRLSPGFHTALWNGTDKEGRSVPSGIYIYSLEVNQNIKKGDLLVNLALERRVMKMTLLR